MAIQAPSIPYSKPVNFSVEIVVSNGTIFHSVGLTVSVEPNPDFTIATTPALVTFFFGEMGTAIFTVVGQYGFTGTVNLANAKSVFRFNCPNGECIRGDFDLTDELAKAVTGKRTTVSGEKSCEGWRSKTTIDTVHCGNILRYKLSLAY